MPGGRIHLLLAQDSGLFGNGALRQLTAPRKFDLDGYGIEEAYIETEPWIFFAEIADLKQR